MIASASTGGRPTADEAHERRRTTLGRAGLVSSATMTSRILGLAREHIFARIFGGGPYADAFVIAFRIPNLLRDLFAEGVMSSALVPALMDVKERKGSDEAFRVGNIVLTAELVLIGVITVLGIVFAPALVDVMGSGFGAETRGIAIELTRWMMPFLFLASWAALNRGVLNSHHNYWIPAVAPVVFNMVALAVGVTMLFVGGAQENAIRAWALAMVGGGFMAAVMQLPAMHKIGYRLRLVFAFGHASFRRILRHMGPAIIGLAAMQINLVVNSALATSVEGDAAALNYSFRLIFLPIGVIGVAVATVSNVTVSASVAREDHKGFQNHLEEALRLVSFFGLPASAGLWFLAEPIVRLLYEYDEFDAATTVRTAQALRWYATGLFFLCAIKVLAPAFYALDRTRVPVIASTTAVVVNLVWAVTTYSTFGFETLAFGTALSGLVNATILTVFMGPHFDRARVLPLVGVLLRMLLLALIVGALAGAIEDQIRTQIGAASFVSRMAAVGVPIAVSLLVVVALGRLLGLTEARDLLAALKGRRSRFDSDSSSD